MFKWLKNFFTKERIVEVEKTVEVEKVIEKKVFVRGFSEAIKEDYAIIWKNNMKILAYLEEAVIYSITVKEVQNKREKELVEIVARKQNEVLKKFYDEFNKK